MTSETLLIFLVLKSISMANGHLADYSTFDNTYTMHVSASNCVRTIANKYFANGSIIGMMSSNFHNQTNKRIGVNTYNVIVATMMRGAHWSIVMKDGAKSAKDDRQVRAL